MSDNPQTLAEKRYEVSIEFAVVDGNLGDVLNELIGKTAVHSGCDIRRNVRDMTWEFHTADELLLAVSKFIGRKGITITHPRYVIN